MCDTDAYHRCFFLLSVIFLITWCNPHIDVCYIITISFCLYIFIHIHTAYYNWHSYFIQPSKSLLFPVLGFLLAFPSPKPTSWVFQPVSRSLHPHPAPLLRFSFRFWVFCRLFCLPNPTRGFFSPFPARYAHILLHFYDLVSGSGFSACFSVSKTHLVGFSTCFPLTTPTSHILSTYHAETAGIPFLPLK